MTAEQSPAIEPSAVEVDHIPTPLPDVVAVEIDGEMVLAAPTVGGRFDTHWLDPRSSMIWRCLDGHVSVSGLADDLAAVFDAEPERVRADLLTAIQALGWGGVLQGVAPPIPLDPVDPVHVPIGTPLPVFTFRDLDGVEDTTALLRGNQTLLVNWSSSCAYCQDVVADLVRVAAAMRRSGDEMVLVVSGERALNHEVAEGEGLDCRWLEADRFPVFEGRGTPVAYLIDPDGRVASPLVVGGPAVVTLGRLSAGLDAPVE